MDSASLIAAGLAALALAFALYQTTISRRSSDAQTRMTYEVLAQIQSSRSRESDPQDSVMQELLARLSSNTEPRTVVVNVAGPRDADRFADSESVGAVNDCGDIVREIAHGLSTPLSQYRCRKPKLAQFYPERILRGRWGLRPRVHVA